MQLFKDIKDHKRFSINVLKNTQNTQNNENFIAIFNLFLPKTIDACFSNEKIDSLLGIKDSGNNWNVKGNGTRIIGITTNELEIFNKIYDSEKGSANQARLPYIHSNQILSSLKKLYTHKTLNEKMNQFVSNRHWDETNSQKDLTIIRSTGFMDSLEEVILSGTHIYVNNPYYKTPNRNCRHQQDFSNIDLVSLHETYIPRTNYIPNIAKQDYSNRIPKTTWKNDKVTNYYRLGFRAMLHPSGERTLISAILPKYVTHINGIISVTFKSFSLLLSTAAYCSSIIADFYVKTMGRSNLHHTWHSFPIIDLSIEMALRVLMLNCISLDYSDLWRDCWDETFKLDSWTKHDARLKNSQFKSLDKKLKVDSLLRSDYQRRQAQLEIDVLIARFLGLSLSELITIYIVQFPVLRQNEMDTWYDKNGRIVFTCSQGLYGVGFPRKSNKTYPVGWEDIKHMKTGTVERIIVDDTLPGGPKERTVTYVAPFDRCDRESDYELAWKAFEERKNNTDAVSE